MTIRRSLIAPLSLPVLLALIASSPAQTEPDSDALNARAQQAFAAQDYPAAADDLEQALAAWDGPHDDAYLTIKLNLAMTYLKLGRGEEGRRLLEEVEQEGAEMARRARGTAQ